MKILILGCDGYIGYPLTLHLLEKGHEVLGVDNFSRRRRVSEFGSDSLTPILSVDERKKYLTQGYTNFRGLVNLSLGVDTYGYIKSVLADFRPDAVVHLAEMPSAPWSMIDAVHAGRTQFENVIGTLDLLWGMREECPEAHLVKLGTMGEYGTPNCIIPEGYIPRQCNESRLTDRDCPMAGLQFPRDAGSFYHLSKVHDTHNIIFACKTWGLTSTDIMQGVLFGLNYEDEDIPLENMTRFDYDESFGTVINRFCVQAIIEHPLTVYGSGNQIRGFLPLKDSIQCLTLAIDHPPNPGTYRVFNQFESVYKISSLAALVCHEASKLGLEVAALNRANPRSEAQTHYYNPVHKKLFDLGYIPTTDIKAEINLLLSQLLPFKGKVNKDVILPHIKWR